MLLYQKIRYCKTCIVMLLLTVSSVNSFASFVTRIQQRKRGNVMISPLSSGKRLRSIVDLINDNEKLTSSSLSQGISSSSSNNNDDGDDFDLMRKILESSWNEEIMGYVPTTPQQAASNAAESVLNAIMISNNSRSDSMTSNNSNNNVYMIDISLPSLDPMNGDNVYDDVGAAEFCIEFAKRLNVNRISCDGLRNDGGVAIVVKDDSLLSRIDRQIVRNKKEVDIDIDDYDDDNMSSSIEFYDDFADLIKDTSTPSSIQSENNITSPENKNQHSSLANINLYSMLGKNNIQIGSPNMINDVVKSVATNVSLKTTNNNNNNEDVIVILAPMSQLELVGVRWLVSKYGGTTGKTIVIFNCKLNPLPNELKMAEMCYSVLPLIARSSSSSQKQQQQQQQQQQSNPKIVLLRRYPKDWEMYIDCNQGTGFELAGSVPAVNVGLTGPSMDWILDCVERYLSLSSSK